MKKGFTLIELLVVISIIGLLASIVLISVNSARIKARDARRKTDLEQIALALELYYDIYATYKVAGTGWNGGGAGWFNYEGGSYAKSIARGLEEEGLFTQAPLDPSGRTSSSASGPAGAYMLYPWGGYANGFCAYAYLERPTAKDSANYNAAIAAGCPNVATYGMNYVVGHP